jgi:aspartyl-tRNA(Asn)/glutamyl-tRNA(Gln) amidotransferase subunit C
MVEWETILAVAENARLNLSEDEVDRFREDFEEILSAFETLDEIDTDGVEPAFHPIELDDRKRKDEPETCLSSEEALENAANTEDGYFKGPRAT